MKHIKVFETTSAFNTWKGENLKTFPYACFCMDSGITYYQDYVNMNPGDIDYVDLGLPSGTLWATENLGGQLNGESYFAWGESFSKSDYSWETYMWGDSSSNLTKYTYSDNKLRMDREDDPTDGAWNWAGTTDWHIPTPDQWCELNDLHYTVWSSYTLDNVPGVKIASISDSSKYIFLPFAGHMEGTTVMNFETVGEYLTLDLYNVAQKGSSGKSNCQIYVIDGTPGSEYSGIGNGPRPYGYSVRPVVGNRSYKYIISEPDSPGQIM